MLSLLPSLSIRLPNPGKNRDVDGSVPQEEEEVKNADTLDLVMSAIFHSRENMGPDKLVWPESIAQCFFPRVVFLLVYFLLIITFQKFFSWNQWDDQQEEDDHEEVNGRDIASNNPVGEAERCEDIKSDSMKNSVS